MLRLNARKVLDEFAPFAADFQRVRLPLIVAKSLTFTAQDAQRAITGRLAEIFDRPNPFTMQAIAIQSATVARPVAAVFLKDEAGKGTPAAAYLGPHVLSGNRNQKRMERLLVARGLLPQGWFAVPGRAAPQDAYGNVPGSVVVRIISDLRAFGEVGFTANRATKARARQSGRKAKAARYFVVAPGGKGQAGIYEKRGEGVIPIFIFTQAPRYRQRFPFFDMAEAAAVAAFPRIFERVLRREIGQ